MNVGRAGWLARIGVLGVSALGACAPGSFTRTVYVPPGKAVQLRETVEGAAVWVLDTNGEPVPGRMDLPEGWYVLPDPGEVK